VNLQTILYHISKRPRIGDARLGKACVHLVHREVCCIFPVPTVREAVFERAEQTWYSDDGPDPRIAALIFRGVIAPLVRPERFGFQGRVVAPPWTRRGALISSSQVSPLEKRRHWSVLCRLSHQELNLRLLMPGLSVLMEFPSHSVWAGTGRSGTSL
jgi:hypothetical protein